MNEKSQIKGILAIILCEIIFGISYIVIKISVEEIYPIYMLAWKYLIAFIIMTILILLKIIKVNYKGKNIKTLIPIILSVPIIYYICESFGIGMVTIAESSIIIAMIPISGIILSTIILGKKPNRFQVIGIILAFIGSVITIYSNSMKASFNLLGYIFLFIGVITYGLYSVLVEKAEEYSAMEITYLIAFFGMIVFFSWAIIRSILLNSFSEFISLPFSNLKMLLSFVYLGVFATVTAYFLSNYAISQVGVNKTVSFVGLSTAVAIIIGVIFLKEKITLVQFIGIMVIFIGIYVANIVIKEKNSD